MIDPQNLATGLLRDPALPRILFRAFERMLEVVQEAGIVADMYPIATRPASEINSARSEDMSAVTSLWLGKLRVPDSYDAPRRWSTEAAPPPPPMDFQWIPIIKAIDQMHRDAGSISRRFHIPAGHVHAIHGLACAALDAASVLRPLRNAVAHGRDLSMSQAILAAGGVSIVLDHATPEEAPHETLARLRRTCTDILQGAAAIGRDVQEIDVDEPPEEEPAYDYTLENAIGGFEQRIESVERGMGDIASAVQGLREMVEAALRREPQAAPAKAAETAPAAENPPAPAPLPETEDPDEDPFSTLPSPPKLTDEQFKQELTTLRRRIWGYGQNSGRPIENWENILQADIVRAILLKRPGHLEAFRKLLREIPRFAEHRDIMTQQLDDNGASIDRLLRSWA